MRMPVKDTSGDGCRCEPEVVVLGSFPPLKGLSPYCAELAKAVSKQVRLHCLSFKRLYPRFLYPGGDSAEGQGAPEDGELGSRVTRKLTWYNPFGWLATGLATQGALLHAQWWTVALAPVYAVICGCFRLRGKPVIITVHNTRFHEGSRLADRVGGWVLRLGTRFIVHAESNAVALAEHYGIPRERISVIPHGPLDLFLKPQGDYADVRHRLGIPAAGKVVLLFGAVRPYKGLDTAIHAFAEVAASDRSVHLLIAGRLWGEWQPYQELVDRHGLAGRVHLHPDYVPTAEVGDYFQAADLVLLPYHSFDSQSGVGAAALAFGKPMLVTDVGGLPELVADRSCVVPPRDVPALAEALRWAFSEPRRLERMREDAQAMAERYSWSGIAEQTRALYEDVLGIRE
jgi:glycosyltransferase involved in cell wall biosynthesis